MFWTVRYQNLTSRPDVLDTDDDARKARQQALEHLSKFGDLLPGHKFEKVIRDRLQK